MKSSRRIDLTGQTFWKLTIIEHVRGTLWRARCACGVEREVHSHNVKSGNTRSCGCYRLGRTIAKNTKHGHVRGGLPTPEYRTWTGIISRCENPNDRGYAYYGARGIQMAPEWRASFEAFLRDVGPKPEGKTLERIDNNGDYAPGNVRWATRKEQARNRRSSRMVYWKGREWSIAALAEAEGVPYKRLWRNLVQRGLSVEKALCRDRGA